jgi:hypothetical protein
MSSKKLKPNQLSANNKEFDSNRESFSGRICDDLCEVLLSYLSFEDKIRFECVSKQWQKVIYNKQYYVEIDEFMFKNKNTLNNSFNGRNENFNFEAFESALKKCEFINEVIADSNTVQVLKLIIKYCNNLKSIAFNITDINDQLIEEFGPKFGQKLRQIQFISAYGSNDNIRKSKKLLRFCPNLITFGDRYVNLLSLFVDKNELLVPKLTSISTEVLSKDIHLMKNLAKNYGNSLKSVSFETFIGIDDIETNILMKQMIHLKNLTELDLMLGSTPISAPIRVKSLSRTWKQLLLIANN